MNMLRMRIVVLMITFLRYLLKKSVEKESDYNKRIRRSIIIIAVPDM